MSETVLVPGIEGSPLALSRVGLANGFTGTIHEEDADSLIYVVSGSGMLAVGDEHWSVTAASAALVLAGEQATVQGELAYLHATVGTAADRHAPLGERETVVQASEARDATGGRSYEVLFGPENGSTRATLFVGHVPAGRAPWHFHLYDEIVWIPEGPARLHLSEGVEDLGAGSAIRLRPRRVHIVENAGDRVMDVVGVFTPAGSPSAAYLADAP